MMIDIFEPKKKKIFFASKNIYLSIKIGRVHQTQMQSQHR